MLTHYAATCPPGLAASYRTIYSIRGLRLTWQPLRYRGASPMLLYEPRLLPARTLRGSDRSATLLYCPTS
ncbi:hypothetical protein [Paramuribaculum intestinale]|uniref:hypothetical protein n=1 Tax=Paramuribaculum intestinale TaxID=2094151 RepID=UPI0025B0D5CA|nr:hypothetical protein [Paramuribaculum intestinale]